MKLQFVNALWKNRELWWRLTERDILGRYRGSLLGWAWSFLQPLAMLVVYTFVFSQVFKARWGNDAHAGPLNFAINLFAGLIVFNLVSECVTKAPGLVLANPNYVKKVIFPLEILGAVAVGSSVFHALTSLLILIIFQLLEMKGLPFTYLWLPLVWLPLILGSVAVTWALSSLGVFVRDIGQLVGLLMSVLMFLSPIFYPISALPPKWRPVLALNPIAQVMEQTRVVTIQRKAPSGLYLLIGTGLGIVVCETCYRGFRKSKRAFADIM